VAAGVRRRPFGATGRSTWGLSDRREAGIADCEARAQPRGGRARRFRGTDAEAPYTVLGWRVEDIAETAAELRSAGVRFKRYDGMDQDDDDVWVAPDGTRVAWFSDPDGNTLSLQQEPSS
jgi:catechol 2,3-dioxygenase-like lactoylglutathione lyase family enzyme